MINPVDCIVRVNEKGEKCIQYGRKYAWGFCDALSDEYSDFGRLYKLVISMHCLRFIIYRYSLELAG